MPLSRRALLAAAAAATGAAPALHPLRPARAADQILAGVSGPLAGPNAQYGAQWKRGFDLALEGINGAGGVGERQAAARDGLALK